MSNFTFLTADKFTFFIAENIKGEKNLFIRNAESETAFEIPFEEAKKMADYARENSHYSLKQEIMRAFEDGKRCGAYKINELPEEYADNRIKELEALND